MTLTFHPSNEAFRGAIDDGYLSEDPKSPSFAGDYMYMGTDSRVCLYDRQGFTDRDLFKHRDTRKYLRVPCQWADMTFSS